MPTFKLNISETGTQSKGQPGYTYEVTTNRQREHLFFFKRSDTDDRTWYFNVPEHNGRDIFTVSENIPVRYITELAMAIIIIRYGILDFDIQLTSKAKQQVKRQVK